LSLVFISGIGLATVNSYLFLYMEHLKISRTLMGVALTVSTISEVPVMFFGDRLLRRFQARGLLALAMGRSVCGWCYTRLRARPGHPAHPVAARPDVPGRAGGGRGLRRSARAAGHAGHGAGHVQRGAAGFGAATGGLLGGWLLEHAGPETMYRVIGLLVLGGLAVFGLLRRGLDDGQPAGNQLT